FLRKSDDFVFRWIADALEHRVVEAAEARSAQGALPSSLLTELERVAANPGDERSLMACFKVDTLRAHSRILEPTWRGNAYRRENVAPTQENLDPTSNPVAVVRSLEQVLDEAASQGPVQLRAALSHAHHVARGITDPLAATLLLDRLLSASLSLGDADAV